MPDGMQYKVKNNLKFKKDSALISRRNKMSTLIEGQDQLDILFPKKIEFACCMPKPSSTGPLVHLHIGSEHSPV
jgi:hypothetical protein